MFGPNTGAKELRRWARRWGVTAADPIPGWARDAIGEHLVSSAKDRITRETSVHGGPLKALSPRYAAWKRKTRGHARIWQLTGESKGKVDWRLAGDTRIEVTINTRYSGVVHDGGTWVVKAPARTQADTDRAKAVGKRNKRRNDRRLRAQYGETGKGATARARAKHGENLRAQAQARRQGRAELLPQFRRPRDPAKPRAARGEAKKKSTKASWVVVMPARPVLGADADDNRVIGNILIAGVRDQIGVNDA